jgi:hypothetical protein
MARKHEIRNMGSCPGHSSEELCNLYKKITLSLGNMLIRYIFEVAKIIANSVQIHMPPRNLYGDYRQKLLFIRPDKMNREQRFPL